jgi:hypothetical protein
MISATITPYKAGYCHVNIDGVSVASFPVGSVPGQPADGSYKPGLSRVVTDEDLDRLAAQVFDVARSRAAEIVHIEAQGPKAHLARRVAERIQREIDSVQEADRVDSTSSCPATVTGTEEDDAPRGAGEPTGENVAPSEVEAAGYTIETPTEATAAPATPEPAVAFTGPCVAGFDPGSVRSALAICDAAGQLVFHTTIPIGRRVPRAKPLITKLKDGSERVTPDKHIITSEDVAGLGEIVIILRRYEVARVVIEWIEHARIGGTPAAMAKKATDIARAQYVAGALHGLLLAADIDVELVVNRVWVAAVTGCKTTKGRRGMIAPAVEKRWPSIVGGNVDERDATGVLAWATMPEPDPAAATTRRERNMLGVRRGPHDARKEKTDAKRAAAGCTCTSRRHVRGCALYVKSTHKRKADRGEALEVV